MKARIFLLLAGLVAASALRAQEPDTVPAVSGAATPAPGVAWSLEACIRYAQQQNISVQQRTLRVEDGRVQLSTAKFSRLPSLGASIGADASFGLSPSRNNVYQSSNSVSGSLGVSANMPLFEGLRINKQIKGAKLDLAAAVMEMERAREDVAVQVMTLYLQVLFTKELVGVAESQLALSTQLAERSRELVAGGKQPESALYESEALQANDALSVTQARNDLTLALLDLSQALNRPSAEGFDIETPPLDSLTLESMRSLGNPDAVYAYADANRPVIRAERLRLESSENAVKIARSALYPSLSLSGGYSTSVYDTREPFWDQFRHSSREYVGVTLSIPIFNRRATRNDIRSKQISLRSQALALTEAQQNLRKEIEQAYYNADAAYAKYRASETALASARIAFAYEQQKAASGRSTVFDYNDAKNRMQKAESERIQAKYEFVFRSRILAFYNGGSLLF